MKHFIYQGNEHDCGFASLKMLLATLANNDSYLYINKPEKKGSYTLREIENLADSFGVKLQTATCDEDYLNKLECPCLALINSNHVVMVKRKTKRSIIVYDPGVGIVKYSRSNFIMIWTRIIVEVEDKSSIQVLSKIRRHILPRKIEILQSIISVISTVALITTLYFFNDLQNFWFSLIFLGVFILSQLTENFFLYKQINYFDKTFIPLYFERDENKNKNKYSEFLNFKRNYFVSNRGLLSSVLVAFVIVFLCCFNNFKNILALLIILLLKIFEILVFSKSSKSFYERVGKLEKESFENPEKNIDYLLSANQQSNSKVFKDSFKNLFFLFLCFGLAVSMMFLTGNSGCDFVIFHFALYFVSYRTFSELLDGLSSKKKLKQDEATFFENCNL